MDISPTSDSAINTPMSAEGVKTTSDVDLKSTSLNENESNDEERVFTRSSQSSNEEIVHADSGVNTGMSADEVNTTREGDYTTSLNENEATDVERVLTRSSQSLNEDIIQEGVYTPTTHVTNDYLTTDTIVDNDMSHEDP